ncbi:MAG TPA: hypothetical protein VFE46_03940 [Pirellulales bacterium]|jgi:hypothetical protein|nr:hypothetical protein [Pirellulales bacterium]
MSNLLQEYCDSRGLALRVDRHAGVIRGIKILGPRSRNGRSYLPDALARAVGLYEGAKVNVNHPKGHPLSPRDYQERIGVIRNVQHRPGDGLFADFHFNPKHHLSEQLMWDAEHAPESVGFSHNVQAQTRRQGETTVIEDILQVHSVDLVADPATTRGLFEEFATTADGCLQTSTDSSAKPSPPQSMTSEDTTFPLAVTDQAANIICELESDSLETHCEEQTTEITRLCSEIDRLHVSHAADQRRTVVQLLLAEYKLPDPAATDAASKAIISDAFLRSLLEAPDEPTVRRLVEERARLLTHAQLWHSNPRSPHRRPISRDQITTDRKGPFDAKSFAREISV